MHAIQAEDSETDFPSCYAMKCQSPDPDLFSNSYLPFVVNFKSEFETRLESLDVIEDELQIVANLFEFDIQANRKMFTPLRLSVRSHRDFYEGSNFLRFLR